MADWTFIEDLRYAETDEWIRVEDGVGTVGLSDYAQDQLSDIVYIELPEVGETFEREAIFGTVESVKAAGDMHVPVGGEVIEVNSTLEDTPEKVNEDPYGEAWFIKIRVSDPAELDALMDMNAYKAHCEART